MVQIKVINKGTQPLPTYATTQSAGMDLRANTDSPITFKANGKAFNSYRIVYFRSLKDMRHRCVHVVAWL